MANRFLNNITINDSYTLPSSDGSADQIIQTDGAGNLTFIDPSVLSVGESEQVHIACKNTSGVAISKGDPVYITGTVGTSFRIEIAAADASNSAKMPAVGLAETDLAHNAEGFVIVSGVLKNLTTDPLSTGDGTPSSNDTVYVKAGGGLTRTKPTGSGNLIQNVGKVGRVNSSNAGSLAVSTIMRTNDVPNLTTGKIWVGSSTYTTESGVIHLDETNNRLGVNETSPSSDLHINNDSTSPVLRLSYVPASGYGGGGSIRFQGGASDYVYGDIGWWNGSSKDADITYSAASRAMSFKVNDRNISTNGYFRFYDDNTEVAEINAAGIYGNVFYDQGNSAYYVNPAGAGNSFNALGYAHIRGGITTDGNARSYTWRALDNTGSSGTRYQKIARITSTQSSRFVIELAGRSTSYSTPLLPAIGYIVGQLNNDNDYDLVFYNHSGEDTVVDEVGQVDVSTTATDIYIKVSSFSEVTAHAHISDGTIAVESTSAGGTEPTNYVAATNITVWNSRNDGAGSGLDADLLDGQHGSYYLDYNNFTNTPTIPSPYTHPTHPGDDINLDTGALTGATVISDLDFNITTDTLGHVTDANATYSTRNLTASDVGAAASSHNHDSTYVNVTGDTMTGKLTLSDSGYEIGNEMMVWKRSYSVNSSSPAELLYNDGNSLPNGGIYRFTAHISGTGTDQFARAVYWNQNGTWKVNVTGQSGTSSNHPEFQIISNGTSNVPHVHIDHTSNYTIHVLGERIALDENTGTDNAGYGFGTDGFLGSVSGNLYFLPGGTSTVGNDPYDDGNRVFHDGYHPNADTWTTARTITIGSSGKSVNGSANVSWSLAEIGAAASSHTHSQYLLNNADDTTSGSLTVGSTSSTANKSLKVLAGDSYIASIEAYGGSQGTGKLYVGQASNYGGGIMYNGDDNPNLPQTTDAISFYRRTNNTEVEVFSYPHGSSVVTFADDIVINGGDITLGGTGRIQGVDTVSAGTDAANKTYVDNAVTGLTEYVAVAGDTMTGPLVIDESDTTDKWLFRVDNNGSNFSGFWSASQDIQLYLRDDAGNVRVQLRPDARSFFYDGLEAANLYDSDNTSYYLNPGGTSNLQELEILRNSSNYTVNLADAHDRAGLMVKSSTNFDSKLAFSSGASSRQYIQALNNAHTTGRDIAINPYGGNVAIGKEAPSEALDVDGSITSNATIWTGYDSGVTNSVSCSNWFRSSGSTGWFNASYGGGIYMVDSTWVRVYNNKKFYADNTIESNSGMYAPIFYDRNNTNYRFNGDASKDGVDLTSSGNFAINVLGTIGGGHIKHNNLETPEMQWSVGGSTDLNWKKLCDIVISDATYSGWGAEIEITDFSGNYGNSTYNGGELYKGALSIAHWGGSGVYTETPYATIPYQFRNDIRWYKIQESGQNRYELQVKSPANYRQLYIKVKPGIGNQIADIISYANDTNGTTTGGTAYTSLQYGDFNQEHAGHFYVNDNQLIGFRNGYGSPYFTNYYGALTTSSTLYVGGPFSTTTSLYAGPTYGSIFYDRNNSTYYMDGSSTGDSIRVAGDVVAYYSSDKRLKDNIKPIENALNKVNAISGVTFEWNEKSHKTTGRKDVGVIAQEVEEVFPEIVETRSNGYKAVDYQKLTAVLIESVKELTAKVEALESKQCK